jgi:hypothetical protein
LVNDGLLLLLYAEHVPDLLDVVGGDAEANDDRGDGSGGGGLVVGGTDVDVERVGRAAADGHPAFFWRRHEARRGRGSICGRGMDILFLFYANRGADSGV